MGSLGQHGVAVVVGANKGIGLGVSKSPPGCYEKLSRGSGFDFFRRREVLFGVQLCQALKSEGYDVLATCRTTSPELDALGVKVVPGGTQRDSTCKFKMRSCCTSGIVQALKQVPVGV